MSTAMSWLWNASRLTQVSSLQRKSATETSLTKQTILFLAANPLGTTELALAREARAIQEELVRSGHGDQFELVTRWAVQPMDLLRELRKIKPTIVHFSGHGGAPDGARRDGLFFEAGNGTAQLVTSEAIAQTFGAAGASVKVVILSACYSSYQTEALLAHVGCVISMSDSVREDSARHFAVGFYGGLSEKESVTAAYRQGQAAISLEGRSESDQPKLHVREGVDANSLVLIASSIQSKAGIIERTAQTSPKIPKSERQSGKRKGIAFELAVRESLRRRRIYYLGCFGVGLAVAIAGFAASECSRHGRIYVDCKSRADVFIDDLKIGRSALWAIVSEGPHIVECRTATGTILRTSIDVRPENVTSIVSQHGNPGLASSSRPPALPGPVEMPDLQADGNRIGRISKNALESSIEIYPENVSDIPQQSSPSSAANSGQSGTLGLVGASRSPSKSPVTSYESPTGISDLATDDQPILMCEGRKSWTFQHPGQYYISIKETATENGFSIPRDELSLCLEYQTSNETGCWIDFLNKGKLWKVTIPDKSSYLHIKWDSHSEDVVASCEGVSIASGAKDAIISFRLAHGKIDLDVHRIGQQP